MAEVYGISIDYSDTDTTWVQGSQHWVKMALPKGDVPEGYKAQFKFINWKDDSVISRNDLGFGRIASGCHGAMLMMLTCLQFDITITDDMPVGPAAVFELVLDQKKLGFEEGDDHVVPFLFIKTIGARSPPPPPPQTSAAESITSVAPSPSESLSPSIAQSLSVTTTVTSVSRNGTSSSSSSSSFVKKPTPAGITDSKNGNPQPMAPMQSSDDSGTGLSRTLVAIITSSCVLGAILLIAGVVTYVRYSRAKEAARKRIDKNRALNSNFSWSTSELGVDSHLIYL